MKHIINFHSSRQNISIVHHISIFIRRFKDNLLRHLQNRVPQAMVLGDDAHKTPQFEQE